MSGRQKTYIKCLIIQSETCHACTLSEFDVQVTWPAQSQLLLVESCRQDYKLAFASVSHLSCVWNKHGLNAPFYLPEMQADAYTWHQHVNSCGESIFCIFNGKMLNTILLSVFGFLEKRYISLWYYCYYDTNDITTLIRPIKYKWQNAIFHFKFILDVFEKYCQSLKVGTE